MSEKRVAGKVGVFVAATVIVALALLFIFTKGASLFTTTYELRLRATSVGGLRENAVVSLSGIVVGHVKQAEVAPEGRGVDVVVRIKEKYRIHSDALFVVEQIGFLGDQYVAIYPQENKGEILAPGAVVPVEEPFSFQEIARSARGLIEQFSQTAKTLNQAMDRVSQTVLSENTLTNVSAGLLNFRTISEQAIVTMESVNALVESNAPPIVIAVSNLVHFSDALDKLAAEMREMVSTNRFELTLAVKNLQTTTRVLESMARDIEAGKGLAGTLVKDAVLQSNVTNLVANLTTLSSNLNRFGLLYKPK
ncbi:MAG: MlaD family protein, partial [Verrucomicrobia subdivision 3 bacterium]|nr:MlaD family protein [Limisphaerales bacterium]